MNSNNGSINVNGIQRGAYAQIVLYCADLIFRVLKDPLHEYCSIVEQKIDRDVLLKCTLNREYYEIHRNRPHKISWLSDSGKYKKRAQTEEIGTTPSSRQVFMSPNQGNKVSLK